MTAGATNKRVPQWTPGVRGVMLRAGEIAAQENDPYIRIVYVERALHEQQCPSCKKLIESEAK